MSQIGMHEDKTRLSQLVKRAKAGEDIGLDRALLQVRRRAARRLRPPLLHRARQPGPLGQGSGGAPRHRPARPLVEHQTWLFGRQLGPSAEALAAACVGVSSRIGQHAVDQDQDLGAAADSAAAFIEGAAGNLDLAALERFDEISRSAGEG